MKYARIELKSSSLLSVQVGNSALHAFAKVDGKNLINRIDGRTIVASYEIPHAQLERLIFAFLRTHLDLTDFWNGQIEFPFEAETQNKTKDHE